VYFFLKVLFEKLSFSKLKRVHDRACGSNQCIRPEERLTKI